MSVRSLIAAAKTAPNPNKRTALPAGPLADLKAVLRANAAEPQRFKRVSAAAFLEHLAKVHNVQIGASTLQRIVRDLGQSWSGVERG